MYLTIDLANKVYNAAKVDDLDPPPFITVSAWKRQGRPDISIM